MSVFLATWDLNKQRENYAQARQNLIEHMARYQHIKDEGLDSVWFIESGATVQAISADIRTRMTGDDKLIVTRLEASQYYGWLDKKVWAWISARL